MDMQGTPIGSTSQGMKNTSDPDRYENPTQEGAGAVARDSLAAESARSGGAFGDNRDSNPLAVKGGNSTLANTETSGAKTLAPSSDAASRDDAWNETGRGEKYPEGAGGQGNYPGSHAGGSYAGGSTGAKQNLDTGSGGDSYDTSGSGGAFSDSGAGGPSADKISSSGQSFLSSAGGGSSNTAGASSGVSGSNTSGQKYASTVGGSSDSTSGGGSSNAGTAPGYTADVTQPFGQGKPKGRNVTEGGFEGEAQPVTDIGSENDPGRKAEGDLQRMTQSASGGTGPNQGMQSGDQPYSALQEDQSL